jgi:DNA-binding CsgD family transcriptional regulator/GAF domain-containing protein
MIPRADIDRLVPAIYEAACAPEGWTDVLRGVAEVVGAEAVFFAQLPYRRLSAGRVWSHEIDSAHVAAFMRDDVVGRSAYAQVCTMMPEGEPFDVSESFSDPRLLADPAVKVFLGPAKLVEGRFGTATKGDGMIVPLACLNSAARGGLDPAQTALMRRLMHHVGQAAKVHLRLARLQGEVQALSSSLQRLTVGVMTVTATLRLRFLNAEAERILSDADGVRLRNLRIGLSDPTVHAALKRAVAGMASCGADEAPACLFVPRPSGAPSYTVVVAPPAASGPASPLAAATLFLTDPVGPTALPAPALLAAGLGLTATEAEVARLAAMGRGMAFVAESLGVSLNTARTHLKAVYAKVGVNHQAALARTIADRFPPIAGLNGEGRTG